MKIAYAQMKIAAGHPDLNTKKILHFIDAARAQGADVVIFPELAISGQMLGDTWEQTSFLNDCSECNKEIFAASRDIVVVFGNVHRILKEKFFVIAKDGKFVSQTDYTSSTEIKLGKKNIE